MNYKRTNRQTNSAHQPVRGSLAARAADPRLHDVLDDLPPRQAAEIPQAVVQGQVGPDTAELAEVRDRLVQVRIGIRDQNPAKFKKLWSESTEDLTLH